MRRRLEVIVERMRKAKPAELREWMLDAGMACVCIGIGAFDWRYGLIAFGAIVSAAALWGKVNDRTIDRPR